MERIKKNYILIMAILFLFPISFASIVTEEASEDTWINGTTTQNFGTDTVIKVFHKNESFRFFLKFNTTQINGHIIDTLKFHYVVNFTSCSDPTANPTFRFLNNNTWKENTLTGANSGLGDFDKNLTNGLDVSAVTSRILDLFHLDYPQMTSVIYNSTNFTMGGEAQSESNNCLAGTYAEIISKEAIIFKPFLNISLVEYQTGQILGSDTTNTWFDLETGTAQSSFFIGADFQYDAINNILYPLEQIRPIAREINDDTNTLINYDCSTFTDYSKNAAFTNINFPLGSKDIFCFNLSSQHLGYAYFGAIKILENTNIRGGVASNPEFDFFYSIQSPNLTLFTDVTLIPEQARAGENLTITWKTTQPLSSIIKYRVNATGNFSNFAYVQNNSFGKSHRETINGINIVPGKYEFFLLGNNSAGNNFTSTVFNFSVGFSSVFENETAYFPEALKDISQTGLTDSPTTAVYLFGIVLLFMVTGISVYYVGLNFGLGILVTTILILSVIGFLPFFIVVPFIVITALIITLLLSKVFHGGGD